MKKYSLGTNLTYMLMAFSKPQLLIKHYLTESSLLYGIIPAIVGEVFYEFLGALEYLLQPQSGASFNPIAQALQLSKREMSLLQVVAHPFVGIADVFLFVGMLYSLSKLFRLNKVSVKLVVSFFMFLWGTFGVLAWFADALVTFRPFGWDFGFLIYIHPLAALAYIVYLTEFIHRQAGMDRWKSLPLVLPSVIVVLASRTIFVQ